MRPELPTSAASVSVWSALAEGGELRDSSWNNDPVFWCIEGDDVLVDPVSGAYG